MDSNVATWTEIVYKPPLTPTTPPVLKERRAFSRHPSKAKPKSPQEPSQQITFSVITSPKPIISTGGGRFEVETWHA